MWNDSCLNSAPKPTDLTQTGRSLEKSSPSLVIARIGAFSGLIAVGTILTNLLFGIAFPPPLYEITVAPAFYMAIAVLFPRKIGLWATAVGSAVGESFNIFLFGEAAATFALTFVPGIVLARAPEVFIIQRFRDKALRLIAIGMVLATVYETVVFFAIDWPVYALTAFYCPSIPCSSSGLVTGFWLAASDFGTLIDLVWVPAALALVLAARRAFNTQFFD